MHPLTDRNPGLALAVRVQIAGGDVRTSIIDGAARRLERLRDDGEAGAQVAEYAMLGGVSAAACGGLVALFKNGHFLEQVVATVVRALTNTIKTWF
jgi:hypothetical protein